MLPQFRVEVMEGRCSDPRSSAPASCSMSGASRESSCARTTSREHACSTVHLLTFDLGRATLLVVRTEGWRVAEGDSPASRRTIAAKLEHLFRSVPGPRGEYSLEEVAAGIRARGGPTVSASYIWQLRKGVKDNPTKKHMEALADFFGIPASYFFDDEAAGRIEAELEMLAALRDAGVRRVALRAAGLSPRSLEAIQTIIEGAREVEGLRDSSSAANVPQPGLDDRADSDASGDP